MSTVGIRLKANIILIILFDTDHLERKKNTQDVPVITIPTFSCEL